MAKLKCSIENSIKLKYLIISSLLLLLVLLNKCFVNGFQQNDINVLDNDVDILTENVLSQLEGQQHHHNQKHHYQNNQNPSGIFSNSNGNGNGNDEMDDGKILLSNNGDDMNVIIYNPTLPPPLPPSINSQYTELSGGIIVGERILNKMESPYLLRTDLEIERGAKLTIGAGVNIQFAPMVGITIRGSIMAIGTPEEKITFTSQQSGHGGPSGNGIIFNPQEIGARLVDGPSPIAGRLQLFHHGKWRSVCTNSRNWTITDYEIACRQMGFQGGRFWNWMERLANYDPRLLYEEPNCHGSEQNLRECLSWHNRQIGAGACDYHNDIGIQCLPVHDNVAAMTGHWRGLHFLNAPSESRLSMDNIVYEQHSQSELNHVDIVRAGIGRAGIVTAALDVFGQPPTVKHVTIDHSAYTGINVTKANSAFVFYNVTVRHSRGIGIFINSSYGLAHFEGCSIIENGADGIRYVGHDLRVDERIDRSQIFDFCTLPTTAGQTYPISVSLQQSPFAGSAKDCGQYFFTRPGYVITVSFMHFMVRTNETAKIEVYDGTSASDRLLGSWMVRNFTRPQSLTSTREKVYIQFNANPRSEMLGFLRLTAGPFKAFDLNVTETLVLDNGGRGIAVDNLRSTLHVHTSDVSNNGHVAGVHVTSGAGDVNITRSKISFNQGDGINITYVGGNRNVSRSSISSNVGYGMAVWLNQTRQMDRLEFYEFNQTSVVEYSNIVKNLEIGILHGNFCGEYWVNITGNHFNDSIGSSIDIQSCWFDYCFARRDRNAVSINEQDAVGLDFNQRQRRHQQINETLLKLQIGHNVFEYDNRIGIIISPAINVYGRIEYNHFRFGKYGSMLIRNKPWEEYRHLPVQLFIQNNQFYNNHGIYVVSIGLSPYVERDVQWLLFTRNFVRMNRIREPFEQGDETVGEGMMGENRLSPRSRVAAPIVITSSNVDVYRNIIQNIESKYEVGSQLSDQSQVLNVTYNWLGHSEESIIFQRLFHRKDRYDLAKIEYLPYLLHNSNPGANTIYYNSLYVPKFYMDGVNQIGGEVDGQEILPTGTYTVDRDINIRPGGTLMLQPGVILNFAPSVGMMVTGKLEARGRYPDDIFFTLKREPIMSTNDSVTEQLNMMDMENMDQETETINTKAINGIVRTNQEDGNGLPSFPEQPMTPLRIIGGPNEHVGRLEIYLGEKWGTVCDYGWTIVDAALACHQMGLAMNPSNWRLLRSEVPNANTEDPILLSNVRCTEHDIDIRRCRAERLSENEFEHSCTHENDVGIRCSEGAWAGLRFGVLAEQADLQYVTVEKAGLFDYSTNSFKPAIQMDFARHNLNNVRVVNNLHDGLGIIYSDIYGGGSINNVQNSEFSNNYGNGISLKQLGLKVHGSMIKENFGSGISHDSVLSDIEQRELAGWFHMASDFNVLESKYRPWILPRDNANIDIDTWQNHHILTTRYQGEESVERTINIRCRPGYVIGLQLLNPIQNGSTEDIWIYDSQTGNLKSAVFQLKRDLNAFPMTSSSYGIQLYYTSGTNAIGGVVLIISTSPAPVQDIKNKIVRGPVPTLQVTRTSIQNNRRGISATYYNRYFGERGELYLRKSNESIKIVQSDISHNYQEAVFVYAPFWDVHLSNLSEITIHINSTLITNNGRGVRQFSRDLRSSNNLYHYVMQDTTIEANRQGGFEINLPFVWQYNENFTHSIYLGNVTWQRNKQFGLEINGHYAAVNITKNVFNENECYNGLIAFRGMEKKMKIDYNRMINNNGRYIVEFRSDSLSEILGEVSAVFTMNEINNNRFEHLSIHSKNGMMIIGGGGGSGGVGSGENIIDNSMSYHASGIARQHAQELRMSMLMMTGNERQQSYSNVKDPTCVIGFNGVQKVRVFRNLITNNAMNYDLIAGVKSARLKNFLDATENWWGSTDSEYILSRIFDFDDWNNYAEVMYQPYLLEDNFDSSMSVSFQERRPVDLERLGGRIFENLLLQRRETPYFVNADITVMPGVTLTIAAGVEMEFAPNVGILVLGTLIARGFQDGDIIMRVQKSQTEALTRRIEKRALENLIAYDTIRLCTERNCSLDDNELNPVHQGFLEYFNHTTLQWVPICDRRFTERNAQVVCRELGFDPLNVFIGHDKRIEYHTNSLTRIWSWVQPLECNGNEQHFHECHERLNGQLYGHRHECRWNDNFVFVSCNSGDTNYNNVESGGGGVVANPIGEIKQYWGGIRFAYSDFEQHSYEHRYHDVNTHSPGVQDRSHIEFIRLENAGMLHNEKSPAIQSILKSPIIGSITIRNSAHHGINLISPRDTIHIQHSTIHNTFGQGIYGISLTGEGRESEESSFQPLKSLDLPYHLFSLIDICDTNKVITIEERVIIYYKYDYNPVNCVKIFNSAYRVKPIGFRLLQSNLFNHSKEYGRRDSIHLYDGDIYNITAKFIGQIESDSTNEKHLFKTRGPILSVRLIASGAPATHGFFAEVVTLPISAIGFNRDAQHNISNTEIRGAIGGAISYHSVGEVSPTLTMENNRIQYNCRQLYGNFSTCDSAIKVDVHNMQALHFRNNLIQQNQGGLFVRADSRGSATSLRGWISHNLFTNNTNRPALYVEGRQSSPYQEVTIFKNYITQNRAGYQDVIRLRQVVSNFTYNYVHSNRGGRILDISGFDKVRLPIYQTTSHNGFYDNVATDWRGRATIVAGTAGQNYVDNIFYNPDNDYEMITVNRSITVDLWKTKIVATHNYWNYNVTLAVSGRIRDRSDDPSLLEVQFMPFHMNNRTVLDGKCPPGWTLLLDTCYMYIGAPMSFYEAREFCRSDNASLPFIHGDNTALWMYLQRQMTHLRFPEKVWVQDINYLERCTSFIYRSVDVDPCDNKYGFICEIDPKVIIDPLSWQADIVAISVISSFVLVLILLILFGFCWCRKSRHRHVQRLERRNSIRQSLRSLNTIDANGSIRRRNYNMSKSTDTLTKSTTTDYKKMMSNGSIDSMDKSVLSSETSYDIYDPQNQPGGYSDMMIKTKPPLNDYQTATINKKPTSAYQHPPSESKVYGLPEYNSGSGVGGNNGSGGGSGRNSGGTNGFELSYRNEGYRDNSTTYTGSGTRNNSIITNINEDTPIIHQIDHDDSNSDYYGNSSTLPIRSKGENLAFLSELKHKLPEYELLPNQSPGHSSFLPAPPDPPYIINNSNNNNNNNSNKNSNNNDSNNKNNNNNFINKKPINKLKNEYDKPEIRRPNVYQVQQPPPPPPPDIKRPDSYYTAMRTARDSAHPISSQQNQGYNHPPQQQQPSPSTIQPSQQIQQRPTSTIIPNPITILNKSPQLQNRPKTVYEAAAEDNNSRSTAYSRSKSEALLETNFDEDMSPSNPLTIDSRSYSQPLETAM